MACLCILGVCIPYSALLPLAAFLLRYISAPLANLKMLIKKFLNWAGLLSSPDVSVHCCANSDSAASCCYPTKNGAASKEAVMSITSVEQWEEHHSNYETIICKFTATWCKPCKSIEPHFQLIAKEYSRSDSAAFVKVDVDEMEILASKYNVSVMPTFVVFKNKYKVEEMRGSNERKLEQLVRKHLEILSSENTKKNS